MISALPAPPESSLPRLPDFIFAKSHEPNDINILRLCDVHNIPVATNIATAEALIHALERGDLDWREYMRN